MNATDISQEELETIYRNLRGGEEVEGWHLHAEYESFPTIVQEKDTAQGGDRAWEKHPIQNRWEEITRSSKRSANS